MRSIQNDNRKIIIPPKNENYIYHTNYTIIIGELHLSYVFLVSSKS